MHASMHAIAAVGLGGACIHVEMVARLQRTLGLIHSDLCDT